MLISGQVRGAETPTVHSSIIFVIERHNQAAHASEPTETEVTADKGKELHNEHKDQNINIVGQTYIDRDSG